jgi:hypothetical protein
MPAPGLYVCAHAGLEAVRMREEKKNQTGWDLNPCSQKEIDFESTALTTRPPIYLELRMLLVLDSLVSQN